MVRATKFRCLFKPIYLGFKGLELIIEVIYLLFVLVTRSDEGTLRALRLLHIRLSDYNLIVIDVILK